MVLSDSFATDEDGDDCWRVHAAVAQQLPVLLNAQVSVTRQLLLTLTGIGPR